MAVAKWSSGAGLMLPLVVVLLAMAVAAGASSTEGVAAVQSGARFSETPMGRKLLGLDLCGSDFDCRPFSWIFTMPRCCTDLLGVKRCVDFASLTQCGSCAGCPWGSICCPSEGTIAMHCANVLTDKNDCGKCGKKCNLNCKIGLCKY